MAKSELRSVVLQVDDLPEEALLLQIAFAEAGIAEHLRSVNSGQQALKYLAGIGEFADRGKFPLPCLVLLDINMPVMNGFEVLAKLRADPRFQELPICMYSSSSQREDIERAVRLGADAHIEKPLAFSAQVEFARSIAQTWFGQPAPQHGRPRVLLRKRRHACHGSQAGCYLQPNGHWSENRETARRFAHTVDAHWWAEEQECLGAEIILAYPDPGADYACMKT